MLHSVCVVYDSYKMRGKETKDKETPCALLQVLPMATKTTATAQELFDKFSENGASINSREVLTKLALPCLEWEGVNGRRKRVFELTKTALLALQNAFRVSNGVSIKKFFHSIKIEKTSEGALTFQGSCLFDAPKSLNIAKNALRRSFKNQIGIDGETIDGARVSFRFFYLSKNQSFFDKEGNLIDSQGKLVS